MIRAWAALGREATAAALEGRATAGLWWRLGVATAASSAAYGATIGTWHGIRLAGYTAVKLPLVLGLTTALTFPLAWIGARLLGVGWTPRQVALLTAVPLQQGALLLAALAPVAALFTVCAPPPGAAARSTHNALYLMHAVFVGGSSLAGCACLARALGRAVADRRRRRAVLMLWILAFAGVGGEVAWALRPFVGSIYHPVRFLRLDPLDGNVYEFILTDIAPWALSVGGGRDRGEDP